ncbi:MAG: DUF1080 domain-containing protein [Bacteroidales bacterium]|nr:DUF1080 domain-containing protein [Bacteroidales bacterium]
MKINTLFKGATWFMLVAVVAACKPGLQDEVVISSGQDQILDHWKAKDITVSGDSIVLGNESATLVSRFHVQNFDLSMTLKTTPGAEGSLSFHTSESGATSGEGYRVMINNSDYRTGSPQKTGSLSMIRNFFVHMVDDGEWFTLNVSVRANHIAVSVGDKIVSEYREPDHPLRTEGNEGMVLSEGLLVLNKSNDEGSIFVSDIRIEGLTDEIPRDTMNFESTDAVAEALTLLNQRGFPVIDFHGHLKGGLTMDQAAEHGRNHGFNYGIAENCGLNFPVTDDATLNAYYDRISGEPVFKAMQCEGREWVNMFSEEPVSLFDYIFSDAMTFTDHKGRRLRLWIPEEVFIDSEEQFMEMLVERAVNIISKEPIDIHVNPTFLPDVLNDKYDILWTPERMDRVIQALVDHDVALEINARYRLPGIAFIQRAKDAGVKFTFGTNNAAANDLGRLEYCLEVLEEVDLTPEDIFLPKPAGDKKVMEMGIPDEMTG